MALTRLWGVRHIRYWYLCWRFARWWEWARHYWVVANPSDLKYLEDVWNGKA